MNNDDESLKVYGYVYNKRLTAILRGKEKNHFAKVVVIVDSGFRIPKQILANVTKKRLEDFDDLELLIKDEDKYTLFAGAVASTLKKRIPYNYRKESIRKLLIYCALEQGPYRDQIYCIIRSFIRNKNNKAAAKITQKNYKTALNDAEEDTVNELKQLRLENLRLEKIIENNCVEYHNSIVDIKRKTEAERTEVNEIIEQTCAEYKKTIAENCAVYEKSTASMKHKVEFEYAEHTKHIDDMKQTFEAEQIEFKNEIAEVKEKLNDKIHTYNSKIDSLTEEIQKGKNRIKSSTTVMRMLQMNITKVLDNCSDFEENSNIDCVDGTFNTEKPKLSKAKVVRISL